MTTRPTWLPLTLALAAGCATAESRSRDVAAEYEEAVRESRQSMPAGQVAYDHAKAAEAEAAKDFPEVSWNYEVSSARERAEDELQAAGRRQRREKARAEMVQIRAELAAGHADAALAHRASALFNDALETEITPEYEALGKEIAAARAAKECGPKLEAFLGAKKLKEARDFAFADGSVCSPDQRARVAQPWLRSLSEAGDACVAAKELLELGLGYGESALDTAIAADPQPRVVEALAAQVNAGTTPACMPEIFARLDKRILGARVTAGFAPLVSAVNLRAQADRDAEQRKATEARNAELEKARAEVARLEKGSKFDDARAVAEAAKDDETVLRLNREHPTALVKRLREEMVRLKDKAPFAAALLQAVAKGYGDQVDTLGRTALERLHPAPPAPRRAPGFMFAEGGGTGGCPDLKMYLGERLNEWAVNRDGGWVIKEATCGRSGAPRAVKSKTVSYESRRESRQVPSGDGITTRTVFVDVPYEVTTESTYSVPASGDYWLSMRVAPYGSSDSEVVAMASAVELGEARDGVLGVFREQLAQRYVLAEQTRVARERSRRLQAALDRLAKATAPDDRADAMAELEALESGSDATVLGWFAQQFALPAPVKWPW